LATTSHPLLHYLLLVIEQISTVGISAVQFRPSRFNSSRRLSGALQDFLSPASVACPLHAALAPSFKRCLPELAFYISHRHVGNWMTSKACTPSPLFRPPMQSASPPFNALALPVVTSDPKPVQFHSFALFPKNQCNSSRRLANSMSRPMPFFTSTHAGLRTHAQSTETPRLVRQLMQTDH